MNVFYVWNLVDPTSIKNSINAAGFAENFIDWHIAKHDVYGARFCTAWSAL